MTYVIFGRHDCPNCDIAENLLKARGLDYQKKILDVDIPKFDVISLLHDLNCPIPRSIPIILTLEGEKYTYIGGLHQLEVHLG